MQKIVALTLLILLMNIPVLKLTAQNVGIGTATPHPTARLHVGIGTSLADGFLVTGTTNTPSSVPDLDAGTRMMFYPGRGAFRAGTVTGFEWNNNKVGDHSAAFGYSTIASGNFSFAAGYLTEASGAKAFSLGENTRAPGNNSVALGYGTQAIGTNSMALGYRTQSQGAYSTAMGRYNEIDTSSISEWQTNDPLLTVGNGTELARHNAMVVYKNGNLVLKNPTTVTGEPASFIIPAIGAGTRMMWLPEKSAFRVGTVGFSSWDAAYIGLYSFASGKNTSAKGYASTAMGSSNSATGDYSTAIGSSNNATGDYSTAMGDSTSATGDLSTAMGYQTFASSYASLVIGQYNDINILNISKTSWEPTDPLLILGNGTSEFDRSDALVVYKNGTTRINGNTTITGNAAINGSTAISGNTGINGNADIYGNTAINGNTDINGYTQLGKASEAAPAIKMKEFSSNSAATQNNWRDVAHGLTVSKILSVSILVNATPALAVQIPPSYTYYAGYE